jgi:AcrR family transcriptional regulator
MVARPLHDARRAELINITAQEISRVGLDGATLRHVARAAQSTTGTVNHYFVDKRDLLTATYQSLADGSRERIAGHVSDGMPLLNAVIDAILPLDDQRLATWRVWLAFWGAAIGDEELSLAQQARYETFRAIVVDGLVAEDAAGRLIAGLDLDYEGRRLVAVLDGIAMQVIFHPTLWPPELQWSVVDDHMAQLRAKPKARRARR